MIGEMGFQVFDGKKMIEENPEYIFFNGRPWSLVEKDGILKAKVGDRVRLFVGNGGVSKVSSFHVIGEIFDRVYPEASTGQPLINVDSGWRRDHHRIHGRRTWGLCSELLMSRIFC